MVEGDASRAPGYYQHPDHPLQHRFWTGTEWRADAASDEAAPEAPVLDVP